MSPQRREEWQEHANRIGWGGAEAFDNEHGSGAWEAIVGRIGRERWEQLTPSQQKQWTDAYERQAPMRQRQRERDRKTRRANRKLIKRRYVGGGKYESTGAGYYKPAHRGFY